MRLSFPQKKSHTGISVWTLKLSHSTFDPFIIYDLTLQSQMSSCYEVQSLQSHPFISALLCLNNWEYAFKIFVFYLNCFTYGMEWKNQPTNKEMAHVGMRMTQRKNGLF